MSRQGPREQKKAKQLWEVAYGGRNYDPAQTNAGGPSSNKRNEHNTPLEYGYGAEYLQDDVPHYSDYKKRRISRGSFRFYNVVRNIYDFDDDDSQNDSGLIKPEQSQRNDMRNEVASGSGYKREARHFSPEQRKVPRYKYDQSESSGILDPRTHPEYQFRSQSKERVDGAFRNMYDDDDESYSRRAPQTRRQSIANEDDQDYGYSYDEPEYYERIDDGNKVFTTKIKLSERRQKPQQDNRDDYLQQNRINTAREAQLQWRNKASSNKAPVSSNVRDKLKVFRDKVSKTQGSQRQDISDTDYDISPQVHQRLTHFRNKVSGPRQQYISGTDYDVSPQVLEKLTLFRNKVSGPRQVEIFDDILDQHMDHPNDYGTTQHRESHKFTNKGGRELLLKEEEIFSELHHVDNEE